MWRVSPQSAYSHHCKEQSVKQCSHCYIKNLLSYIAIGDRVVWEHCAFYNRVWRIRLSLGICRLKKIVVKQEKIYNENIDKDKIKPYLLSTKKKIYNILHLILFFYSILIRKELYLNHRLQVSTPFAVHTFSNMYSYRHPAFCPYILLTPNHNRFSSQD